MHSVQGVCLSREWRRYHGQSGIGVWAGWRGGASARTERKISQSCSRRSLADTKRTPLGALAASAIAGVTSTSMAGIRVRVVEVGSLADLMMLPLGATWEIVVKS